MATARSRSCCRRVRPSATPSRPCGSSRRGSSGAAKRSRAAAREVGRAPGTVPYLGERLTLVPEPGRARVHRRGDRLLVPEGEGARAAIERWYRRQARVEVAPRLDAACRRAGDDLHGPDDPRAAARAGRRARPRARCRSTGGCCSPRRRSSTTWSSTRSRHIEVMDHSPRFWRLLASRSPRWREHSAWLRRYGSTLTLSPAQRLERVSAIARAACGATRPVQATSEPSPRTSIPAGTPRP